MKVIKPLSFFPEIVKSCILLGCCLGCFIATDTMAQVTDLARLEFTYFPQGKSDNSFRRIRTFINVPIQFGDDAYLVPGIGYRNINLRLGDDLPFADSDLERYQSLNFSLGYTDKMKNGWRYAIQGGVILTSNFTGDITADDYVFEGAVFFIRDRTGDRDENSPGKPWRLITGLSYSTTAGRPFPLPIINYYREFAPKWSFTVGVPKMNVKHKISPKSTFQAFVTLDGFYANIQENIAIPGENEGENISMTTVLSGIGYEYEFMDHLLFYVYGGYTIINDIRLRDGAGNDVFTINDTNNIYARSGIKFKI